MFALKLAGGLIVIAAATALGFLAAANYERRPRELAELISALGLLETEIAYAATPLAEAFGSIASRSGQPARGIVAEARRCLTSGEGRPAAEVWSSAVQKVWTATSLKAADRDILLDFGASLGASDREDQIKHICLARERLRRAEGEAIGEAGRLARLYKNLGFLGGVMVVIILL
ncbi:MAG TPA: stage III sporulation protein SpoIIIAB [Bacillota bacterium]|jgi:stage III sporulation protein AB